MNNADHARDLRTMAGVLTDIGSNMEMLHTDLIWRSSVKGVLLEFAKLTREDAAVFESRDDDEEA